MNKKSLLLIVLFFAVLIPTIQPIVASADIGPKPSVVIDFKGIENQIYYATLLSEKNRIGPHNVALKDENGDFVDYSMRYENTHKDYEIFLKFLSYEDTDGYFFLQYFSDCTTSNTFRWGYYPPTNFKILIYFPDTDSFITSSQVLKRYAFDSYFTCEVNLDENVANSSIKAAKSYDYFKEIVSLIVRITLTILIELAIAILFGFRSKNRFLFIAIVNIVTQVALNITLNIINYNMGALAFVVFFVLLEIAVFIVEAIIYSVFLNRLKGEMIPSWKPAAYAFVSNAVSFILGLGLAAIIPKIF